MFSNILSPYKKWINLGVYDGCINKIPPMDFFSVMHVKMKIPPLLVQSYFLYQTVMEIN